MRITGIICGRDSVRVLTDAEDGERLTVCAFVPLINGKEKKRELRYPGRRVFSCEADVHGGCLTFPRFPGYDLLIARFEITRDGSPLEGPCYVTDTEPGFSASDKPYPEPARPIGTWCIAPDEDIGYMRMGVMMDEIDEAWLFASKPGDNDIVHVWNGDEYRFDRAHTEMHDKYLSKLASKGIPTLIRFINRKNFQRFKGDDTVFERIRHPDYETDFDGAEMSAVNVRTEEGFRRYCAALDFLFNRYSSEGSPYGISAVTDIGNEINSARIWNNAGKAECADYMEEYTVALRTASLLSKQYRSRHTVNVSLEMNFSRPYIDDPLHYYPARQCLEELLKNCRRDGDFEWGVSAHPYPERLDHPDFYNDPTPDFTTDTKIITMKNLEVWPLLLSQPEYLYRGSPRCLVFDEQGFNTRTGEPHTEEEGAWAFILAYLKIKKLGEKGLPRLRYFLIHRHIDLDDGDEYGLHLGLRYFGGYSDGDHLFPSPGPRKLICEAIAATGTEHENEWIERARNGIGQKLFDSLLDPPLITQTKKKKNTTDQKEV